jgi:hypothetical protein
MILCGFPIAFILATHLGDILVLKIYSYKIRPKEFCGNEYERWRYGRGFNWYAAPGCGLRIIIHILTQAALFLLLLLLIAKYLPPIQKTATNKLHFLWMSLQQKGTCYARIATLMLRQYKAPYYIYCACLQFLRFFYMP